jgi:hypothetical protein
LYATNWQSTRFGPLSLPKLIHRGGETVDKLKGLGVAVPRPNRLERALELLTQFDSDELHIREDDPETQVRVADALRDVWEAFLIVYTRLNRPRQAHMLPADELRYLVLGSDTTAEERNPKPRSSQFEMMVAARLILGGADLRREEPDIRFLFHGEYIGLAAKRIRKARTATVYDALRDATHQLADRKVMGFIAFALDSWVKGLHLRDGADEYGLEFERQLQEVRNLIARTPDNEYVLGVMLFAHDVGWRFEQRRPQIDWSEGLQIARFSDEEQEAIRTEQFFGPLQERMWRSGQEVSRLITGKRKSA